MSNPSAEPLIGSFTTPTTMEDNTISMKEPEIAPLDKAGEYTLKSLNLLEEPIAPSSAVTRRFVEHYVTDALDEQMKRVEMEKERFCQKFATEQMKRIVEEMERYGQKFSGEQSKRFEAEMERYEQKLTPLETGVAKIPALESDLEGQNTLLANIEERLSILHDQSTASSQLVNELLQEIERVKGDIRIQIRVMTDVSAETGNVNDKLVALRASLLDIAGKVRALELAGKV